MKKKQDKLFTLLLEIAANMRDCGEAFASQKLANKIDLAVFRESIKNYESAGDELVHQTVIELNHSLIAPIDPEDIFDLADNMDDIVDSMEEISVYFDIFEYLEPDPAIEEFRENYKKCTAELYRCIEHLVDRKLTHIKQHTVRVKSYEEACDAIEREAIKNLFSECTDAIKLIKYKDLYHMLEDGIDGCQHVAVLLDSVVMKNA